MAVNSQSDFFPSWQEIRHDSGNRYCVEGWCGCWEYPRKCDCGGLIHADYEDESYDGDIVLITKCDKCGNP